jgi:hypothetical protein
MSFKLPLKIRITLFLIRTAKPFGVLAAIAQDSRSVGEFSFYLGYNRFSYPRWFRKLVARSELHRAWLGGFTGTSVKDLDPEWLGCESYLCVDKASM